MPSPLKIFFDGGCRPNPGAIEIAVVAGGRTQVRRDIGRGSSADAEWLALIWAMEIARSLGIADFVLMGDARSVIDQANGMVKARGAALAHLEAFRALAAVPPRIRHIKRTQNLAGIALAKLHPR